MAAILIVREEITIVSFIDEEMKRIMSISMVEHTGDTHEEADLGKDYILRRNSRFLVLERKPCGRDSPHDVLVELSIAMNKDAIPSDFKIIDKTMDTHEKCFKNKYLCAKFDRWRPHMTAVTDILVFRNPSYVGKGCTLVGFLSEHRVLACTQSAIGDEVPQQKKVPDRPDPPKNPIKYNPMIGVPFELTIDCRVGDSDSILKRCSVHPKSPQAIENQYSFDFSLERSLKAC